MQVAAMQPDSSRFEGCRAMRGLNGAAARYDSGCLRAGLEMKAPDPNVVARPGAGVSGGITECNKLDSTLVSVRQLVARQESAARETQAIQAGF